MNWVSDHFMGHGHCYLWRNDLLLMHISSDVLISAAYFSIPVALSVLVKKRTDLEYSWVFLLFALFITFCGLTHVMNIWNVWHGHYYFSGTIKIFTAAFSVLTAIAIWPLIPRIIALPSPSAMAAANAGLRQEVALRQASELRLENLTLELEEKVQELTRTKDSLELEARKRRKLEEQLREQNQALKTSNVELEQFAFVASHDLREPLRKMLSFSQLLTSERYGNLDERGQQFLGYIQDAAQRMDTLLTSLLDYSRVSSTGFAAGPVDLNNVLEKVKADLQLTIEEAGATITSDPLGTVNGDPSQISQLLQNLIGNSLKYRKEDQAPLIHISGTALDNGDYELSVTDNGIGFDMSYREQIFEVFKRLHKREAYAGTGVGLAICRKIVEKHGGDISVESQPNVGTCFRVRLPTPAKGESTA